MIILEIRFDSRRKLHAEKPLANYNGGDTPTTCNCQRLDMIRIISIKKEKNSLDYAK